MAHMLDRRSRGRPPPRSAHRLYRWRRRGRRRTARPCSRRCFRRATQHHTFAGRRSRSPPLSLFRSIRRRCRWEPDRCRPGRLRWNNPRPWCTCGDLDKACRGRRNRRRALRRSSRNPDMSARHRPGSHRRGFRNAPAACTPRTCPLRRTRVLRRRGRAFRRADCPDRTPRRNSSGRRTERAPLDSRHRLRRGPREGPAPLLPAPFHPALLLPRGKRQSPGAASPCRRRLP